MNNNCQFNNSQSSTTNFYSLLKVLQQKVDIIICKILPKKLERIYTKNTKTITHTGLGTCKEPLESEVKISVLANNSLQLKDDGLYVNPNDEFGGISTLNSPTIGFTGNGLSNSKLQANILSGSISESYLNASLIDKINTFLKHANTSSTTISYINEILAVYVNIDPDNTNALKLRSNGLYVASGGNEPTQIINSNTISVSGVGSLGSPYKMDIIDASISEVKLDPTLRNKFNISTSIDNMLINNNGLYVKNTGHHKAVDEMLDSSITPPVSPNLGYRYATLTNNVIYEWNGSSYVIEGTNDGDCVLAIVTKYADNSEVQYEHYHVQGGSWAIDTDSNAIKAVSINNQPLIEPDVNGNVYLEVDTISDVVDTDPLNYYGRIKDSWVKLNDIFPEIDSSTESILLEESAQAINASQSQIDLSGKVITNIDGVYPDNEGMYSFVLENNNIYVDQNSNQTKETGSIFYPYKTLQSAIDNAPFSSTIHVASGNELNENIVINDITNIIIRTDSVIGQYRSTIDGTITISGTSLRIGLSGLSFKGKFTHDAPGGLVYVDNCAFIGLESTINSAGYLRFDYCFFEQDVTLNGTSYIDIRSSQFEDESVTYLNNGSLNVTDVDFITCAHTSGTLISRGFTSFISTSSHSDGLSSTASLPSALLLLGATFLNTNGTYARINKTGNCPYLFGVVVHEPQIDILSGTRIDGGLHATDLYAHFTPVNYTKLNDTIQEHLKGIDAQLGSSTVVIEQTTGNSTTSVMSQKAVTDAITSAGGGDMLKSVYDTNDDGKVNRSELSDDTQAHIILTNNPHSVTKLQVGLGNVDNTSDANKPISTATQTALNNKVNVDGSKVLTDLNLPLPTVGNQFLRSTGGLTAVWDTPMQQSDIDSSNTNSKTISASLLKINLDSKLSQSNVVQGDGIKVTPGSGNVTLSIVSKTTRNLTSLTSIDISKYEHVYMDLISNQTLSITGIPIDTFYIFIRNNTVNPYTITMPSVLPYKNLTGGNVTVPAGKYAEISINYNSISSTYLFTYTIEP